MNSIKSIHDSHIHVIVKGDSSDVDDDNHSKRRRNIVNDAAMQISKWCVLSSSPPTPPKGALEYDFHVHTILDFCSSPLSPQLMSAFCTMPLGLKADFICGSHLKQRCPPDKKRWAKRAEKRLHELDPAATRRQEVGFTQHWTHSIPLLFKPSSFSLAE